MGLTDYQYSLTQTAAPSVEPLTLAEAKAHLRVTHSAEDDLITSMITSARLEAERYLNRQLITATWVLRMDRFPPIFEMPWPSLLTVTSVAYVDGAGDSQTLTVTTDYDVDIYSVPGRIVPAFSKAWPSTRGHINDVTVTYTAGYGAASTNIPQPIIQAISLYLGHIYENREKSVVGAPIAMFDTAERLLYPYRYMTGL